MRGHFDNSVQWLNRMPPSVLSTEGSAARLTEALKKRTGVPWIVTLVAPGRRHGGGFFIAPSPDRLDKGLITPRDWGHLRRLFGAVPAPSCRWYMFPDEASTAFELLGIPIYSGRVESP